MSIFPSSTSVTKRGKKQEISPLRAQVVGILATTLGVLLLLSVVSFHPRDPLLFAAHDLYDDLNEMWTMHNWVGKAGATCALVLVEAFGGAAYMIPLLLCVFGVRTWITENVNVKLRGVVGAVLAMLSLSALLHFQVDRIPNVHGVDVGVGLAGGVIGQAAADVLAVNFAMVGSHVLLLAALVVAIVLLAPASIPGTARLVFAWSGAATTAVKHGLEQRAAARAERKSVKPNKSVKINRSGPIRGGIGGLLSDAGEPKPSKNRSRENSEELSDDERLLLDDDGGAKRLFSTDVVAEDYEPPSPTELLAQTKGRSARQTDQVLETQSMVLTETLANFGIEGKVTEVHPGPVITMYEFAPGPGIKVSRIVNLADDLAMALKALKVRVVAPLPGKSTVGIEVPNPVRETVSLRDMLTSPVFLRSKAKLSLALGKDIYGHPVVSDLRTMPHLLVAGATGAGKSVGLNCMLLNILFTAHPHEVKLLLIDPKVLELQVYDGIPHLIRPVITDPKSAARGLTWAVQEMERRYRLLAEYGVRSIDAYNRKVAELRDAAAAPAPKRKKAADAERERLEADDAADAPESSEPSPLPFIVVVIDEFADLMMVAPKEVEDRIARLAQMARASGIHLILATQRPSVDVVTGLIKANFPVRIAYQVSSKIDSRTILDTNGAETLLGKGDMLYMASGSGRITRLHGPFVSDEEVRDVVEWVKRQAKPVYEDEDLFQHTESAEDDQERDETYERARELILETGQASASFVQRRLRVGYPRAARMIEQMEQEGLVSAPGRDGRREVLTRQAVIGETG